MTNLIFFSSWEEEALPQKQGEMKMTGFSTRVIHTGYLKKDAHNALQIPIYSNAAFEFDTVEDMELAFQGRRADHSYSRISNPTVENFEQRVRSVTGAMGVTALSTGMAAIANVFFTIAGSGGNIVTSKHLFGNTYSLLTSTLSAFNVETRFCDLTNPTEVAGSVDRDTIAIYFETVTNPQLEVADIRKLAEISAENRIPLISDTTLTPFNIFNASEYGINIEIVSSTKIITGGATSLGGLVIDYGTFNWDNSKKLCDVASRFGPFAFNAKLRKEIHRNLGATMSPYHAYLQSLGMETLSLRYERVASNCMQIAEFLKTQKKIRKVNYPGLKDSEFYSVSFRQFGKYPAALLTFELGSRDECFRFLNKLKLISRATNIYDNRSLIMHPASTIYCDYPIEKREELGVPDNLIRLSAGIEEAEDLISDISQAIESI